MSPASRPSAGLTAAAPAAPAASSPVASSSAPARPMPLWPRPSWPALSAEASRAARAARCSALRWVSAKPAGPVHALAPPELSTTARARPSASTCWHHSTGAALTRLPVNTPRRQSTAPSLSHDRDVRATGGLDTGRDPRGAKATRGSVTLTARLRPRRGRSSRAGRASGWRPGRPGRAAPLPRLSMAVTTTAPGPSIDHGLQVRAVGAAHRGGAPAMAGRQDVRTAVGVGGSEHRAHVRSRGDRTGGPGSDGGEDPRAASAPAPA